MSPRRGITIALVGPDALIRSALSKALRGNGFRRLGWAAVYARQLPAGNFVCNIHHAKHHNSALLEAGCVVVWCGDSPAKSAGDQAIASNNFALMGHIQAQVFSVNSAVCKQFVLAVTRNELCGRPGKTQRWFGALATELPTYVHPRKGG